MRSSVLDHTCASLSIGSATGTKTVPMELTRVSKLAAVSEGVQAGAGYGQNEYTFI